MFQKFIFVCIQISADALYGAVNGVFRADGNVLVRTEYLPLYVQSKTTVGQYIQALIGVDAEYIHGHLLNGQTAVGALFFCL